MEYYKKIRNIREDLDIKQYQFARSIGVLPKTYNLYENGYRSIPYKTLSSILATLRLSLDYLLDLKEENTEQEFGDIDKKAIASNFRKYRKQFHLTQVEVAKILNCSQQALSQYENGNSTIPLVLLKKFCEELKLSADVVAGRCDPR